MPRGWGKTTTLVMRSSATNYPILCMSYATKKVIQDRASELKIIIPEPIVLCDVVSHTERYRGLWPRKVLVDDADLLLQDIIYDLLHAGIDSISMTLSGES